MELTGEEQAILSGQRGATLRKALESVVAYGEVFGARRLVPIDGPSHLVVSIGAGLVKPYLDMVDELVEAGLRTVHPFTTDPRPMDRENMQYGLLDRALFKLMFSEQASYERQLARLGLRDDRAFSCASYLPEVGNRPSKGQVLVWSDSSAVVYANSVLAARTNRNAAGIDLLCAVLGKAPLFGLLTDEGRRATWKVEVRTSSLPDAQLLGSALGLRVLEEVPWLVGLDTLLGRELTDSVQDWLKDMGTSASASGAVGLYHVEGLTPEAVEQGRALLAEGHRTYVIDDAELARVRASYPVLWKDEDAWPRKAFIGCPHLSLSQVRWWSRSLLEGLREQGRSRVSVDTWLCTAPGVLEQFRASQAEYEQLLEAGVRLTNLCPMSGMSNPLWSRMPVLTNSGKLRTYSTARYLPTEELLHLLVRGEPSGGG